MNRPLLVVKQVPFHKGQGFLEIVVDNGKILITTVVSIENIGAIIASNMFIHSSTGVLEINGKRSGRDEQKYKPLNPNDNLSALYIPPNQKIERRMTYSFQLPPDLAKENLKKEKISLIQNMLIYYYSDTKPLPHVLAKDVHHATNVTNIIQYNDYVTNMQFFF